MFDCRGREPTLLVIKLQLVIFHQVTSARMRHEKLRLKSLFKRGSSSASSGAIPKQPQVRKHIWLFLTSRRYSYFRSTMCSKVNEKLTRSLR